MSQAKSPPLEVLLFEIIFHRIKIVIKKLDCFGSNEPHNDAQLIVSRHVIAKAILHFTSLLVVIPTSSEVYCKMKNPAY